MASGTAANTRRVLDAGLVAEALREAPVGRRLAWMSERLGSEWRSFAVEAARHFRMEALSMADLRRLRPDFDAIGYSDCLRRGILVGREDGQPLPMVVVSDPTDHRLMVWLGVRLRGVPVRHGFALQDDLRAALAAAEKSIKAMDSVSVQAETAAPDAEQSLRLSISDIDASSSPVVRLVDSTLYDALRSGASDIHLETGPAGMVIKYRLDGVLETVKTLDSLEIAHQVISRIKIVSELDIAERRIPQDGRFKVYSDGRDIDFRVSIMPNLFGEDAVLRVLDRKHLTGQFKALTLDTLGFPREALDFIRSTAQLPYGLLLVTGPTGSGKTTTLYAALSEIHTGLDKIVTIEDPIEYQLAGVLQIPVNEKKGLTFARGLRSILRHDPDKIMVGEIRDAETAQIAVQAALTGHQVFTSVHANNVFDVIGRFANMGVDSYSLVAALNGIVAQRLVRLTCQACSAPAPADPQLLRRSGIAPERAARAQFRRALGCAQCRGSGYRGRKAIAETLRLTDALRDHMVQRAPLTVIRQTARAEGFRSLRDAAVDLACSGDTTLDEINRVTPVE